VWGPHPNNSNDQASHVIVPSIPGLGWSDWPPRAGWALQDTACIFDQLMKTLSCSEYMAQCGDWGHFVDRELGAKYTTYCKLIHVHFAPSALPQQVQPTDRESSVAARVDNRLETYLGYTICLRSRVSNWTICVIISANATTHSLTPSALVPIII
jgi:hypothetical protein